MERLQLECDGCGSNYELSSEGTEKLNEGVISCFVCGQTIFQYNGLVAYYPFLKDRKENHINIDNGLAFPD